MQSIGGKESIVRSNSSHPLQNFKEMAYFDNNVSRAADFKVPSTSQGIKTVSATRGHGRIKQKEQVGSRMVAISYEADNSQRILPVQTYQRQLDGMVLKEGPRSQTPTRRTRKAIRAGLVSVDLHDPNT